MEAGMARGEAGVTTQKIAKPGFRRWDLLLVFAIVLLAAWPRLYLAGAQAVDYDGYWHVFIAGQDNWANFKYELDSNAHPPLYFLLLKLVLVLGHTPLVYRSISLITGLGTIFLAWRILGKISAWRWSPVVGALAYGLALPGIVMSCEVRSYMLCVFFALTSFYYFLDLAAPADAPRAGSRVLFAAGAILACLSHYSGFFYSAACMAVGLVLAIAEALELRLGRSYLVVAWRKSPILRSGLKYAATFAPVLAVIAWLYLSHAGKHANIQGHLLPYYLRPDTPETVNQFLRRNFKNLLNLLGPFPFVSRAAYRIALALLGFSAAGLIWALRRWREAVNARAVVTAAVALLMLIEIMSTGVMGKYPFGGDLRQQFILFPFLLFSAAVLFDRIFLLLPPRAAAALACAAGVAVMAVSFVRLREYPKWSGKVFAPEMTRYLQAVPDAGTVYVDQFNLIGYFMHHDDWRWTFVGRNPTGSGEVDVYKLTRGKDSVLLFRDKGRWNIDYGEPAVFHDMARSMQWMKVPALSLFCVRQFPEPGKVLQLRRRVYEMSAAAHTCVQALNVSTMNLFAEFRQSGCSGVAAQQMATHMSGLFDDRSDELEYSGRWVNGPFPQAVEGTISASNDPRASVRLSFSGTDVTYVYTTAWNRGFAEVYIDGQPKAKLDLYSAAIGWQTKREFSGLAPGEHTIEVRVLGQHGPAATDAQVDLDAFLVR